LSSNIIGRKKQARQIIEYIESIQHGLLVPVISVYGRSDSGKYAIVIDHDIQLMDLISDL